MHARRSRVLPVNPRPRHSLRVAARVARLALVSPVPTSKGARLTAALGKTRTDKLFRVARGIDPTAPRPVHVMNLRAAAIAAKKRNLLRAYF